MSPRRVFPPIAGIATKMEETPMRTAWFLAAEQGDATAVRDFLCGFIDIDAEDAVVGCTALQLAASCGHDVVVELLLEGNADDMRTTQAEPRTALELAGYNGYKRCAWLLFKWRVKRGLATSSPFEMRLRLGAELTLKASEFLHAARKGDNERIEAALKENSAFVNALDKKTGETALSAAVARGQKSTCELLLRHGAYVVGVCSQALTDDAAPTERNDSLVRFATMRWDLPLLRWLLTHGANPYSRVVDEDCSALAWAAFHGRVDFVDAFLKTGAELDAVQCAWIPPPATLSWRVWNFQEKGTTPSSWLLLSIACWRRHKALVTYLLDSCSQLHDEELITAHGPTMLYIAMHQQEEDIVKELLSHGVPSTAQDPLVSTTLEAAVCVDPDTDLAQLYEQYCSETLTALDSSVITAARQCLATASAPSARRQFALLEGESYAITHSMS